MVTGASGEGDAGAGTWLRGGAAGTAAFRRGRGGAVLVGADLRGVADGLGDTDVGTGTSLGDALGVALGDALGDALGTTSGVETGTGTGTRLGVRLGAGRGGLTDVAVSGTCGGRIAAVDSATTTTASAARPASATRLLSTYSR